MKVGISAGTANSLLGPLLPFFMQCIKNPPQAAACGGLVGVWRFELQASWSRTKRSTKLSYTPIYILIFNAKIS